MSGIGYIPFSEIKLFLDEFGIKDFIERQEYIKWIQFIDAEDVRLTAEKHNKKSKSKTAIGGSTRPPAKRR